MISYQSIVDKITTHNFDSVECIVLEKLNEIDYMIKDYHTIVIDEGQFFSDLKSTVLIWLENYSVNIIVGGLDGDFQKNPIGMILDLIPHSDSCIKLCSLCNVCKDGTPAPFSLRTVKSDDKVLVGGAESYIPVCRKHYMSL